MTLMSEPAIFISYSINKSIIMKYSSRKSDNKIKQEGFVGIGGRIEEILNIWIATGFQSAVAEIERVYDKEDVNEIVNALIVRKRHGIDGYCFGF